MRSSTSTAEAGLYIHVPFCRSKCPYCDFYSVASRGLVRRWLTAVDQEALLHQSKFANFTSVFLGGGTPSLLDPEEIRSLMISLDRRFRISTDAEITIEVNPDDVTRERLSLYKELGINRISIGAQSFSDSELRILGRRHTGEQAKLAVELSMQSGISKVSVDLMYGFQGHTASQWDATLKTVLRLGPSHLSCYQMTIEDGTLFGKLKAEGKLTTPGEDAEREFFLMTSRLLQESGYTQYEVSSYCRGMENACLHNLKYWDGSEYLGLGPSAHSFLNRKRWMNTKSIKTYCDRLSSGVNPVREEEQLTDEQMLLEKIYLGFRSIVGVETGLLGEIDSGLTVLGGLVSSGLLRVEGGRAFATTDGLVVADSLPIMFYPAG